MRIQSQFSENTTTQNPQCISENSESPSNHHIYIYIHHGIAVQVLFQLTIFPLENKSPSKKKKKKKFCSN